MALSEAQRLVFEHLNKEIGRLNQIESMDWMTTPVPLEEFVKDHLGLPPLSNRQLQDVLTFLGTDPKTIFKQATPYNTMCMLAGKGSGKDYLASIVICYALYILLCLRNPQEFLGIAPGEAIDILVVSYSQEQSIQISFDKIKQRIKGWWWLRTKYSIFWGEKYITDKGKPEIFVLNEMIKTHNNIRIHAQHSANEGYEGYNVIMFVLSESSAFKSQVKERNGQRVFSTLRTSATSRFGRRWKGMVMSFPRYEEDVDFTYCLYNTRLTDPSLFATIGAPWDYKPAKYFCGVTFDYQGIQVPIEYKEDFDSEPEEAERKYLCRPAKPGLSIFSEEIIISGVAMEKEPLLKFSQYISDKNMIRMHIDGLERHDLFMFDYLLTVDLGKAHSAAAICLQHVEDGVYVQDAVGAWTPDEAKKVTIDMMDVKAWLIHILKSIPRVTIAFDQWQSLILMEELQAMGAIVEGYHTFDRDYPIFKKAIALGKVRLLDDNGLLTQLKSLRDKDGTVRQNTSIAKRKDLVDVTVGGFKVLFSKIKPVAGLDGYILSANLNEYGTFIA